MHFAQKLGDMGPVQFVSQALYYVKTSIIFFNSYLAVPRPTLGHSQGGTLTNLMLMFFDDFDPKVTGTLVTRLGP